MGVNALAPLDLVALGVYLLAVFGVATVVARRQRSAEDFFLAGRGVPAWAASLSLIATSLSAVTFIGAPEAAYAGDLTYLATNLGVILAALLTALLFIPAFHKYRVPTVYALLEHRFSPGARKSASAMFLMGRLLASGARLFAASLPVSLLLFGDVAPNHLTVSIAIIALVATVYTLTGGVAAVIFTDAAQLIVLLISASVAIWLLASDLPGDLADNLARLTEAKTESGASKLTVFDFSLDLSRPFTIWSALLGFSLFNLAAYATDQDLAQRLLTCKSPAKSSLAVGAASVLGLPVAGVFLVIGLLLFLRDDAAGGAQADAREIFLRFILNEMPVGLKGLMLAGLFAAAMSSLDSALNAMSSALFSDFLERGGADRKSGFDVLLARGGVALFAALLASVATVCVYWQQASGEGLLEFALGVMVYAYAGLLGVFLTAVLTKRGRTWSVLAALGAGAAAVFVMQHPGVVGLTFDISFGWRMLFGTIVAFGVCGVAPGAAGEGK